jgi:hypothetical protein
MRSRSTAPSVLVCGQSLRTESLLAWNRRHSHEVTLQLFSRPPRRPHLLPRDEHELVAGVRRARLRRVCVGQQDPSRRAPRLELDFCHECLARDRAEAAIWRKLRPPQALKRRGVVDDVEDAQRIAAGPICPAG